jgi:hypothetical protein
MAGLSVLLSLQVMGMGCHVDGTPSTVLRTMTPTVLPKGQS